MIEDAGQLDPGHVLLVKRPGRAAAQHVRIQIKNPVRQREAVGIQAEHAVWREPRFHVFLGKLLAKQGSHIQNLHRAG